MSGRQLLSNTHYSALLFYAPTVALASSAFILESAVVVEVGGGDIGAAEARVRSV